MSAERIPSETSSKERVAQLSKAMRRDAASISEGVARTLDSVGMMETIVTREAESIERCVSENEKRLPRHAYMPFGAGPRFCPGRHLASDALGV